MEIKHKARMGAELLLLLISALILSIYQFYFHHEFLLHLAAIPLEVFAGVFLVGTYIYNEQKKKSELVSRKFRELLFRVELSEFLYHCLNITECPKIELKKLSELKERSEERRVGKECRSRWSP